MIETLPIIAAAVQAVPAREMTEARLVDDFGGAVYKFCRRITGAKDDADELFQETYLKVFSQMAKVQKTQNPQSFLLSTAAYLWKSKCRKYARRNRLAPEAELEAADSGGTSAPSTEDEYLWQEEQLAVRRLVGALPDKLKIPVILYYANEMSVADIAAALQIPTGTVKSRLHKARGIVEKGLVSEYGC
ncbi:MAG: RNA polymerase sigma factor [Oscillospiraceae bacterium]|nr:RNA polymerase sigma factor [Oscillospiraceae bacterium]